MLASNYVKQIAVKTDEGYEYTDIGVDSDHVEIPYGEGDKITLEEALDDIYNAIDEIASNSSAGAVPVNHASEDETYGTGNESQFGHVKLSDEYSLSNFAMPCQATNGAWSGKAPSLYALHALGASKAPTNHVSESAYYGMANESYYGHVKLMNNYAATPNSSLSNTGVAASMYAVQETYAKANAAYVQAVSANANAFNAYKMATNAAPRNHRTNYLASNNNDYGLGTGLYYGHIRLSDDYSYPTSFTNTRADNSVGASLWAVNLLYSKITGLENKVTAMEDGGYELLGTVSFSDVSSFNSGELALSTTCHKSSSNTNFNNNLNCSNGTNPATPNSNQAQNFWGYLSFSTSATYWVKSTTTAYLYGSNTRPNANLSSSDFFDNMVTNRILIETGRGQRTFSNELVYSSNTSQMITFYNRIY